MIDYANEEEQYLQFIDSSYHYIIYDVFDNNVKRKNPISPETGQLVEEEIGYIYRIYRKEKPNIEGFKEILSRSGYHYATGLSSIFHELPDLVAFKDINEASVVIFVWLDDKLWIHYPAAIKIDPPAKENLDFLIEERGPYSFYTVKLPFRYNNKTKLLNAIRKILEYKMWCNAVMQRDGNKCQICKRGLEELYYLKCELNVHHLVPLHHLIEAFKIRTLEDALECPEIFDLDNGITCCDVCHRIKFHPSGTRFTKTYPDFIFDD